MKRKLLYNANSFKEYLTYQNVYYGNQSNYKERKESNYKESNYNANWEVICYALSSVDTEMGKSTVFRISCILY